MIARVVYCNGEWIPEQSAGFSLYDAGVQMGDIAYEVTRTIHQQPFRLSAHIDRLYRSLSALQIDPLISPAGMSDATERTLAQNLATESADTDWNIIHNVSRGPSRAFADAFDPRAFRPTVLISCYPLVDKAASLVAAYDQGVDLIVPPQRSLPHELLDASIKTRNRLHYQLANLQAEALFPGSWAALVDPDGYLTEGTSGNLFLACDGRLHTPAPRNLLPGVTRQVVLELAAKLGIPAVVRDLRPAEAESADEMFVTSTSIGIIHARSFNRQPLGNGPPGPVAEKLRGAFYQQVGLDFAAQARRYAERVSQKPRRG